MIEKKSYSQFRAMLAIARASFISIFRSPSAVAFSFAFPMFFILVFGFIGRGSISLKVGITPGSDTTGRMYTELKTRPEIKMVLDGSADEMRSTLEKGKLDGVLTIANSTDSTKPPLQLTLQTSKASGEGGAMLKMMMMYAVGQANLAMATDAPKIAELSTLEVKDHAYKSIDFILPGMLGFSLLSMGVFGTAFVFLNLRNTLVIKRFFATPIQKTYIILGEGLSRVMFALITSSFIIIMGYLALGFTLQHGIVTFINMLILSFIALSVFMGFGFIISGLAKNDSAVPPLANLITLPQFILGGTFFSTSFLPPWLQPIPKLLPLTYLNDAMRKVSFEGASLFSVWNDIAVLLVWGVVVYALATRLFKWE